MGTLQNHGTYLSVNEVAKRWQADKGTVYNQVEDGLPAYIGSYSVKPFQLWNLTEDQRTRLRFLVRDIERWEAGEKQLRTFDFPETPSMTKAPEKWGDFPPEVVELVTSAHKEVNALFKGMMDKDILGEPDYEAKETMFDAYQRAALYYFKEMQWEVLEKKYLKGENGIQIFMPTPKEAKEKDDPSTKQRRRDIIGKLYQVIISDRLPGLDAALGAKKLYKLHQEISKASKL